MGETTAIQLATYTSLAEVVSGALGRKKGGATKAPITEDLSQAAPEHFAARVSQMLSF